jgi:4-hydroxybenzoate polyprenyltransferase
MEYFGYRDTYDFPSDREDVWENLERKFKDFIEFLIFSSVFVGIAGAGMIYTSCLIQGVLDAPPIIVIMFLVAFSVYNLNRKTDEKEDAINHQERYSFTKKFEKTLFYSALLAYLLALCIAAFYGFMALLITAIPLVSGILYSVPCLPKPLTYRRLKEIPVMKNLIVSLAWSLILCLLPVYVTHTPLGIQAFMTWIFFFTYVLIASIIPDMRDREGDKLSGIQTIPVIIGVQRTKTVLGCMNLIIGGVVLLLGMQLGNLLITYLLAAGILYTQICIFCFGRLKRSDIICDVFTDGQFIILGGMLYIVTSMRIFW